MPIAANSAPIVLNKYRDLIRLFNSICDRNYKCSSIFTHGKKMLSFRGFLLSIADLIIIISPTIGHIDIIRLMLKTRNICYYDLHSVLLIIISQGLKLLYYFYHHYAMRIFWQAVGLLVTVNIMTFVKFCFCNREKVSTDKGDSQVYEHSRTNSTTIKLCYFNIWRSHSIFQFYICLIFYALIILILCALASHTFGLLIAVETIGLFSNMVEALISFPVFYRIVILSNIFATSPVLIVQYLFADITKLSVYVISKVPFSFYPGAILRLVVDILTNLKFIIIYCNGGKFHLKHTKNEVMSPLIDDIQATLSDQMDASNEIE